MADTQDSVASDSSSSNSPRPIRLWPAVIITVLCPVLVITLFAVPFDDLIQGWHRVVGSGVIILATIVALTVWLFFRSNISMPMCKRITALAVLLLLAAVAVFHIRGYDGNMLPLIAPRGWVLSLVGAAPATVVENAEAEQSTDAKGQRLRELAGNGERANDVLEFLGPGRKPVFDARLNPDWTAHPPEELWRRPLGEAFSSFAVIGHVAITQEQIGSDEAISCFDLETGELLWRHLDQGEHFTSSLGGNGPRSTPTIHQERVYTMGATGVLNCLDLYTGEELWSHSVLKDNNAEIPLWGISGSPLIVDGNVVVSGGDQGDADKTTRPHAVLLAYDKVTGEPVWRGAGDKNASYGSPELATVGGVRQILIFTAAHVVGHNADTGEAIWSYDWPGNMPNVAQVVRLTDNHVFASKGYAMGSVVIDLTPDESGQIPSRPEHVWREKRLMKTKFTNAVFRGGYAYGLSDGLLECIDVDNHKRKWKTRADYGQGQVVLIGDHLLIQAESGDVALVNVNPEKHEEVARFSPLSARTWNYPVLVGDRLLVRNDQEMACYRVKLAE